VTRLTNDPGQDEEPSWSPDGLRIAYYRNQNGGFDIFIRAVRTLDDQPGPSTQLDDAFPTWSPDGTEIAFSRIDENGNAVTVVAPAFGGNGRPTKTAENERDPFWST
jgi:Tol biopolymer transport system component